MHGCPDGQCCGTSIIAHHFRPDNGFGNRIKAFPQGVQVCCSSIVVFLRNAAIQLDDMVGCDEQRTAQVGRIRVAQRGIPHHHIGHGVGFQIVKDVQPLGPGQVIQPVTVLQVLHLVFEDEVER